MFIYSSSAAANIVRDEPLSTSFNGILGLAPPLNSYIAENVSPASSSNSRDGSPFSSNLFAISPSSSRPSYRFLSLTLERPESNEVPSLLGLGRHPSQSDGIQGIDASKVEYTSLVVEASGAYFWKTTVSAITVWVNGSPMPITLMSNEGGGQQVTAVVDSGMPIILTSVGIANGIYGALGVGPSSDGQCEFSPFFMSFSFLCCSSFDI